MDKSIIKFSCQVAPHLTEPVRYHSKFFPFPLLKALTSIVALEHQRDSAAFLCWHSGCWSEPYKGTQHDMVVTARTHKGFTKPAPQKAKPSVNGAGFSLVSACPTQCWPRAGPWWHGGCLAISPEHKEMSLSPFALEHKGSAMASLGMLGISMLGFIKEG